MGIGQVSGKKTIGTQSVSGPAQPSKPAPSVEYTESALGKAKVVTDGKTEVVTDKYTGKDDVARGARQAYFNQHGAWPPCINTSCRSYGRPHPNCLCYGNHSDAGTFYAHGGEVCSSGYGHHEKCEHYAEGGEVAETSLFHNNPVDALDHYAIHHGLSGIMSKIGFSKEPHKHLEDFMKTSKRGHKTLENYMKGLLIPNTTKIDHDKASTEVLKAHLQDVREHPEKLLSVGGDLASTHPDHAIQLAGKVGTATNYFNGLNPPRVQENPLDTPEPPDKIAEAHYDRHLDIAQNPMLILQHLKDGTLRPDDIQTVQTLYPSLAKSISSKAFEQLVNAKEKGIEIPYKQKMGLSLLLDQPLDATMTPMAMNAIINSAGPQQAKNQQKAQPKPKKASGVELNQLNKVNKLDATSLQSREMNRKD